ncbi:hypothetical protein OG741_13770 [Streptomyces sp. NBC_01410]|uniref:hypothetical protein n=1 Tax=Streptomyces sp. NBC_01410 TaxID=2903856 RepID=UPI003246A891
MDLPTPLPAPGKPSVGGRNALAHVVPLNVARNVARGFLAEAEAVDYDRPVQVYGSHGALTVALRQLLDALDAEATQ